MAQAASILVPQIHHEKQESGSMLCAQHALNALLQGNYYDPSQLADIAKQLDQLEQSHVDAATWQARGNDSASLNMDDTGYFSVSVLENALEVWGLRLVRWRSEEMQPLQDKPEDQLAFVLNLESHWFTIRSFTGGYWFNLNSFLDNPSWVGPSYLGALLNAAETEGYSVFAVRAAADHAIGNLRSSAADECAATLPPATTLTEQVSDGDTSALSSHGLRPSAGVESLPKASTMDAEDDADIQAALQASLAHAAISTGSNDSPESSSRMQSPTIVGQRRTRMGPANGQNNVDDDQEETDAHVDAIAPSRRRVRGMGPSLAIDTPGTSSSRTSPYILPTASGGRRRASRQQQTAEEEGPRRRAGFGSGNSRDNAISIDDTSFQSNSSGRQRGNPVTITDADIDDDNDDDDDVGLLGATASSAPRSPFLNPAIFNVPGGSGSNSDDDFHSLSDGESGGALGESVMMQNDINAIRGHASMRPARDYDDEDAQLQAALAASMREGGTGADSEVPESTSISGGFVDDVAAADWLNEEDARAIREAQASFVGGRDNVRTSAPMMRSSSSRTSPPPADVERIARMRAEALRKAQEEEETRAQGKDPSATGAGPAQKGSGGFQDDDKSADEDSSDDEGPQMSPEEMRRARLARFGA